MKMKYEFRGEKFKSLYSCYMRNKRAVSVSYNTVNNRLKQGWSLEKAFMAPKQKKVATKLGSHMVEGKEYPNLPAISAEYGIPVNTIYKRYSRGHRGDDLVPNKKRKSYVEPSTKVKPFFYAGGDGYKSAAEACRQLNIKYVTYRSRIDRGLSVEQALELEPMPDGRLLRSKKFEIDGKLYNLKELADKFSINYETIRYRLRRGASTRQAVGLDHIKRGELVYRNAQKIKKRKKIKLEVRGKDYNSYQELADAYGLPYYVVQQRIVNYGYTAEEAVLSDGKVNPVSFRGVKYRSVAELANAHNLTREELQARLDRGWTLEEATGLEIRITSRTIEYNGEIYDSIVELADSCGISVAALRYRTQAGMTIDEAVAAGERITNSGRYNKTILERDRDLAEKPGILYFISFDLDGVTKHKIGITSESIAGRFKTADFDYKVVTVVKDTLLNCYLLEQELIELLVDKRDESITSDMLDGYTEIFDLSDDDVSVVLELLSPTN